MARSSFAKLAFLLCSVLLFAAAQADQKQCMDYFNSLNRDKIQEVRDLGARPKTIHPSSIHTPILQSIYPLQFHLNTCMFCCLPPQQAPTCKQGMSGFRGCCNEVCCSCVPTADCVQAVLELDGRNMSLCATPACKVKAGIRGMSLPCY